MVLTVDIGNTISKAAIYHGSAIIDSISFDQNSLEALQILLASHPEISKSIVASVQPLSELLLQTLSCIPSVHILDKNTALPFQMAYRTPETLGVDRIAGVAAAWRKFPNQNVLVIDMGTCITYDFLQNDGTYLGGAISPGIFMRFKAMHAFTSRLPLAEPIYPSPLIGQSTIGSLQSGVMNGVQAEMEAIITNYEAIYKDLTILIGGGDNKYFDKKFKINIFATSNLVLDGLKVLLDFNEKD